MHIPATHLSQGSLQGAAEPFLGAGPPLPCCCWGPHGSKGRNGPQPQGLWQGSQGCSGDGAQVQSYSSACLLALSVFFVFWSLRFLPDADSSTCAHPWGNLDLALTKCTYDLFFF